MPTTYAIPDGRTVMAATTYTGTGASLAISNAVNGVSMQPDLVWAKIRTPNAYDHRLYNSVTGTGASLSSNTTGLETSYSGVTSFNSNGFTLGSAAGSNESGSSFIGWQWKANSSFDLLQSYTTAGSYTYTVPAGVTSLRVLVIGGGGASGGSGAGAGNGGAGGTSSFSTVSAGGGGGGGGGPNTPGSAGAGGTGSGGDGGWNGGAGEAGTGSGVQGTMGTGGLYGYGNSNGHYGWGGGGGGGASRYATLSVTAGQTYSVTVGAAGAPSGAGSGGGGAAGIVGGVFIYSSSNWPVNTDGTIKANVSANTTAGFSVVTYTGTGANATVGHGLGVAPSMIILKSRVSATNWVVYHANLTSAAYVIQLNLTNAQSSSPTIFNSTAPTSSVFSIGTSSASNDTSMVAYCFAAVKGFSAFGSYTGNGSADGTFVYTGFRPRWLLLKNTGGVASWYCLDSSRNTYNVEDAVLVPNTSAAEVAITSVDFLSNGFKLRTTTTDINGSGTTYIYACFAENPFKYANAR